MSFPHGRRWRALFFAFGLAIAPAFAPYARAQSLPSIEGTVIDAGSGVALDAATVLIDGTSRSATTDARGHFTLTGLHVGTYRLRISRQGYQPAISTAIALETRTSVLVTLELQRATTGLQTIATTSISVAHTLAQSSTYAQTLNAQALVRSGVVRAADALRELPGVNNGITGDTAALGDDVNLNIRGIGTQETVATIDGHPIGYGIKGGYNYQLSPVFPYRNISVLYGSGGSNIVGVNAIGGVVNFQTLDPTPEQRVTATQGFGTFERLATSVSATGAQGKLGYALAYGSAGLDGPFRNATFFQVAAGSSYVDDSSVASRAGLVKLRYDAGPSTSIQFTNVAQSYWENKTGNGDGDYLPYDTAYARAVAEGQANPTQYAAGTTGWQGSGPAWQGFNFGYQDLGIHQRDGEGTIVLDGFTTRYSDTSYRLNLPFKHVLGDTSKTGFSQVTSSGSTLGDEFDLPSNDVEFGYTYLNNAYLYKTIKPAGLTQTNPDTVETAYFLRDVLHPDGSPVTAFLNLWGKRATITNSSYLDPRLSIVDRVTSRDVVRVAYGATTTEPTPDQLNQPFSASALAEGTLQGAGGGQSYVCGGLNSIGTGSPTLLAALTPERGVDAEAAYGHTWSGDSITQVQLYNVNVFNKLFPEILPLAQTGTSFIPAADIANANAALAGVCGAGNYGLGVTQTLNVGTLRASGADVSGRWRLTRSFYADYDWSLTSTVLVNPPPGLLASNLTFVPGSQLPRVPLHTFSGSLDDTLRGGLDLRYTFHAWSANNSKSLPAYDYSDLQLRYPQRYGTLTVTVSNLFNQWANIAGLIGEGRPLALNGYANAASYAPYIGTAATERYGLPYRQIYFSYEWRR